MNLSFTEVAEVPPGVVMVMSTIPVPDGDVAVICVPVFVKMVAVEAPKFTAVAPIRSVPVIVTPVPPNVEPVGGATLVTIGRAT